MTTPFSLSQIRNIKREEYFAKNKDKIAEKVIAEDSEESYKTPQVLIDQLFRLFFLGKFSDQIVKEQIETVLIAGNETSALTLSYTILLLAMYPDIQERLYEELRSVYDTQDEDTSYERIQQMPYLDQVLKEGMRMFPVAPFIVRSATADTQISNCVIPKNAIIMMSIFNLQRVSQIILVVLIQIKLETVASVTTQLKQLSSTLYAYYWKLIRSYISI